ncbi:hypothetical protein CEXT_512451 [Caerostris extrusa]|uniref:Uncharacterized protein n=1 Tax=Caerostris extrusa TaxID=172846 RepID=A0AAV4WN51_CAEEX|nr:hypothetical protein CEXT_512451 [Caerostris extrusa]
MFFVRFCAEVLSSSPLNRTWCPDHFHCNNLHCKTQLLASVSWRSRGQLCCENCFTRPSSRPFVTSAKSESKGQSSRSFTLPERSGQTMASGVLHLRLLPQALRKQLFFYLKMDCPTERYVLSFEGMPENLEGQSFYAKGGKAILQTACAIKR